MKLYAKPATCIFCIHLTAAMWHLCAQLVDLRMTGSFQLRIKIDVFSLLIQLGTYLLPTFFWYVVACSTQSVISHDFANGDTD